jgi:hypothetical protein
MKTRHGSRRRCGAADRRGSSAGQDIKFLYLIPTTKILPVFPLPVIAVN